MAQTTLQISLRNGNRSSEKSVMGLFKNTVVIVATDAEFSFAVNGGSPFRVPTFLYAKRNGAKVEVVTIGTRPSATVAGATRIDLFQESGKDRILSKADCLASFLKYGIAKSMEGKLALVRP